ncbi:cation:proton antiporter [Streptomyces sp. CSDS2]|uniref:cation:proton antiporter domain-containing protein n=1 Tax=Streptomyces sp. CSDS2 TaxID=3055051 RepID=UPI0025B053B4|nr:cation:proton antiporter [Streptomyces sp. CSDS2]MDN3259858.1 cation:proton antiporter [Streptomyces sp. CSDS2]
MTSHQTDVLQATVLADVGVVLVVGALLLRLCRKSRQPTVIGEILAGIALGPSLLGLLPGDPTRHLFPEAGRPYLSAMAQLGLLLFMFVLGWELEPRHLHGAKRSITMVTMGSMALPFALGTGAAALVYDQHRSVAGQPVSFWVFGGFLGISMAITAFPVLARILADHGLGSTRIGTLSLASAAVGDVLAWCLLAVVVGTATSSGLGQFATTVGGSVLYVAVLALVVRPLLRVAVPAAFRRTGRGLSPTLYLAGLVAAGIFFSSYATTRIGIHPVFGAFAFGLVMPREPRRELEQSMLRPFQGVSQVLMPVYFVVTGLAVDIGGLRGRDWLELALLVTAACAGKILGAGIPALRLGLGRRESLSLGVLMNVRGLTELIILNIGLSLHVLDERLFTVMVLVALFTTALAGPLLPLVLPRHTIRPPAPPALEPASAHPADAERPGSTGSTGKAR